LHLEDVEIALDIDRYDFAMRVEFEKGLPVAHGKAGLTPKSANPSLCSLIGDRSNPLAYGLHCGGSVTQIARLDALDEKVID